MMTPKQEAALRLTQRITDYLAGGGLYNPELADHGAVRDLLIDCREALAEQPAQQEPVALDVTIEGDSAKLLASMLEPVLEDEPTPIRLLVGKGHSGHGLYVAAAEYQEEGAVLLVNTSPPASKPWVGLTQKDIDIAFDDTQEGGGFDEFARAIEAKLKERNA